MTEKSSTTRRLAAGSPQQYGRGRMVGVVSSVDGRAKGFIFLRDGSNQEYFAHRSAFVQHSDFDRIAVGDPVSFRETTTTKGVRAFDIRLATEAEQATIEQQEENRGNR